MASVDTFDAATKIADALEGLTDIECRRSIQMALVSVGRNGLLVVQPEDQGDHLNVNQRETPMIRSIDRYDHFHNPGDENG